MYQVSMIHIMTVQQALKICTAEKFRSVFNPYPANVENKVSS